MQTINNVNDLRAILSDEISKLRDGRTTANNVTAIVKATGKIIDSVKLEMEYNRLMGERPAIGFIPTTETKKLG